MGISFSSVWSLKERDKGKNSSLFSFNSASADASSPFSRVFCDRFVWETMVEWSRYPMSSLRAQLNSKKQVGSLGSLLPLGGCRINNPATTEAEVVGSPLCRVSRPGWSFLRILTLLDIPCIPVKSKIELFLENHISSPSEPLKRRKYSRRATKEFWLYRPCEDQLHPMRDSHKIHAACILFHLQSRSNS